MSFKKLCASPLFDAHLKVNFHPLLFSYWTTLFFLRLSFPSFLLLLITSIYSPVERVVASPRRMSWSMRWMDQLSPYLLIAKYHRASNSIQFQLTINVTAVSLTPRTTSGSRRRAQGRQRRLHRRRLRRAGHHASKSTLNTALSVVMTEAETALQPLPPSTASPSWG